MFTLKLKTIEDLQTHETFEEEVGLLKDVSNLKLLQQNILRNFASH